MDKLQQKLIPEVKEKIIGDSEVVTVRPADLIEDQYQKFAKRLKNTLNLTKM